MTGGATGLPLSPLSMSVADGTDITDDMVYSVLSERQNGF